MRNLATVPPQLVTTKPLGPDLGMGSDLGMETERGMGSDPGVGADKRKAGDSNVAAMFELFVNEPPDTNQHQVLDRKVSGAIRFAIAPYFSTAGIANL
jgi:hypothetical protein